MIHGLVSSTLSPASDLRRVNLNPAAQGVPGQSIVKVATTAHPAWTLALWIFLLWLVVRHL